MDRLISRCYEWQCSQMQPGLCVREKCRSHCYPVSPFHILILILILPTEFLRGSSAWHRTPAGRSHTRGRTEVSEPLSNEHPWYSDLYSVRGNAKFPMYKHTPMPPFCYGTVYIYTRLVSWSQPHSPEQRNVFIRRTQTQHLIAKPRIAS